MTQTTPAALMAVVHAAHVSGDRSLERGARRELLESFGIEVSYRRTPPNFQEDRRDDRN